MSDHTYRDTSRAPSEMGPNWRAADVLKSRTAWLAAAAPVLLAAAALNWNWLLLAGAAPLVLKLLPCAAMCAMGLCGRGSECKSAFETAGVGSAARLSSMGGGR